MLTYDSKLAIEAQRRYCAEHQKPLVAPSNGWCNSCGRNIYEPYTYRGYLGHPDITVGIPVEDAGAEHVTACPHCHHSFCD